MSEPRPHPHLQAPRDHVDHDSDKETCAYSVIYSFSGCFQPVDMDKVNIAEAGSAIPVTFSLHGEFGLNIVAAGYPTFTITGTSQNGDAIEGDRQRDEELA